MVLASKPGPTVFWAASSSCPSGTAPVWCLLWTGRASWADWPVGGTSAAATRRAHTSGTFQPLPACWRSMCATIYPSSRCTTSASLPPPFPFSSALQRVRGRSLMESSQGACVCVCVCVCAAELLEVKLWKESELWMWWRRQEEVGDSELRYEQVSKREEEGGRARRCWLQPFL